MQHLMFFLGIILNSKIFLMKKIYTLIVFGLFFSSIHAQQIDENQWTLVSKRTADWCSLCGGWGWNFMRNINEDLKNDKVLVWATHYSGNLSNPISIGVANNFGVVPQPAFFVNDENMGVTSANTAAKRTELVSLARELNNFPPFAGLGVEALFNNGTIEVKTAVEFFENFSNADMYVANYIVRDNLIASQTGQGPNARHTNVLSSEVTNTAFGRPINMSSISKGDKFDFTSELSNFNLHSDKTEDVKIAAVLWNKVGNKYIFINATVTELQLSSNVQEKNIASNIKWIRMPNGIEIKNLADTGIEKVNMYDLQGREMNVAQNTTSANSIYIDTTSLPSGSYFINIMTASGKQSIQVFVD